MSLWPFWWRLPGPSSYLSRLLSELQNGHSLLLEWPAHSPRQWLAGLQTYDENWCGDRSCSRFGFEAFQGMEPEEFLYEKILRREVPITELRPENLVQVESFLMRVIVLDEMNVSSWAKWRPFLEKYASAARSLDSWQRTQFVVSLQGDACLESPGKYEFLKVHRWDGYVTSLDMQMYAAYRLRERKLPYGIEYKLLHALLTRLSIWDPALVDALCECSIEQLCNPDALLQDFADGRNWAGVGLESREKAWALGVLQKFENIDTPHGSRLDLCSAQNAPTYRIWQAQMEVLLPILERERHQIIDRFRTKLEVPFVTPTERIEDVRDLELGMILRQMSQNRDRFRDADREHVRMWRDVRNELAHFEPVSPGLLERCLRWV